MSPARRSLAGFALALVVTLVTLGWLWQSGLAKTRGRGRLAALSSPVDVVRDRHGVAHIFAQTDLDAVRAQGYVHAQDRLWQRRVASGRLSELVGEEALEVDRFVRTLGVRQAAERALDRLPRESVALLEAYAAGINGLLAEEPPLPPEFRLLRASRPDPWTPVDSLAWQKMMAWNLSGNQSLELLRLRLRQAVGDHRAAMLFPDPELAETSSLDLPPATADGPAGTRGSPAQGTTHRWAGRGQQRLGRRGHAHRQRASDAGQRPASGRAAARAMAPRRAAGRYPPRDGRLHGGPAAGPARPQQGRGVGHDESRRGCPGLVHREARSRGSDTLREPGWLAGDRGARRAHHGTRARRGRDLVRPIHAQRSPALGCHERGRPAGVPRRGSDRLGPALDGPSTSGTPRSPPCSRSAEPGEVARPSMRSRLGRPRRSTWSGPTPKARSGGRPSGASRSAREVTGCCR